MSRRVDIREGACGRCRARHHCTGTIVGCACECCGVVVQSDDDVRILGTHGTYRGFAFVWCERGAHYHLASRRARSERIPSHGSVRMVWRDRLTAGTSTVTVRVGAFTFDRSDAHASRDRHGATPSALPSVARDSHPVPLTTAARTALRNSTRPTTVADRTAHAKERATWARAFDARLAARERSNA